MAAVESEPRVCEFYLLPRGCVKGDKCDFMHPNAPGGQVTTKVCQYYQQPKGCIKGDQCDFLHPVGVNPRSEAGQSMAQQQQGRVCTFFGTPRGCIKGDACDFQHPAMGANPMHGAQAGAYGMGMGMEGYGMAAMGGMGMGAMGGMGGMGMGGGMGGGAPADTRRACTFFGTPRGCIKGNACDFSHIPAGAGAGAGAGGYGGAYGAPAAYGTPGAYGAPQAYGGFPGQQAPGPGRTVMTPMGPVNSAGQLMRAKVCEFFSTEKGCVKGDMCEFIHQKQKQCEFYSSPKGCRKGTFCDHLHDGEAGGQAGNGQRMCKFFSTPAGCRKGDACDHVHDGTDAAGKVAKPVAKARYAPY